MIELKTEGRPLPSGIRVGVPYVIDVTINGGTPIFCEWNTYSGVTPVDNGRGSSLRLVAESAGSLTLTVRAVDSSGNSEEEIAIIPVSARRFNAPLLGIRWSSLHVDQGEPVHALITYYDPEGATSTGLSWTLYWNNTFLSSGSSPRVDITAAQHGVYRLRAEATESTGATITSDSSIRVGGVYEVLPSIVHPVEGVTLHYLGCLYSDTFTLQAGVATYLPYEVATFVQDTVVLPGTTHIRFVLDDASTVDDEVVVRTNTGNYALVGPPSGLTTEDLSYDYTLDSVFLPAPADKRIAYTLDVINTSGYVISASAVRVKIECYYENEPVYEYYRCSYSQFPGGAGERQRRFIAVIDNIDVVLDDVYRKGRGGSEEVVTYSTQLPDRVYATASAEGLPYDHLPATGASYTDGNVVCYYDAETHTGLPVLQANGVYALSDIRPFTLNLTTPAEYPIVHRIKRVHGSMAVYMAAGGINEGASVTVRIKTNNGYRSHVIYPSDVYNPDSSVYIKIGTVDVDVTDYGFDIGGVTILVTVNE